MLVVAPRSWLHRISFGKASESRWTPRTTAQRQRLQRSDFCSSVWLSAAERSEAMIKRLETRCVLEPAIENALRLRDLSLTRSSCPRPLPSSPRQIVVADWRKNEYFKEDEYCNEFHHVDLRVLDACLKVSKGCDWVFNLAADMVRFSLNIAQRAASLMP